MTATLTERGELHCLLCGRYLADVEAHADGKVHLRRPPQVRDLNDVVRIVDGKLHCTHCGGRAFVEWDLLGATRQPKTRAA